MPLATERRSQTHVNGRVVVPVGGHRGFPERRPIDGSDRVPTKRRRPITVPSPPVPRGRRAATRRLGLSRRRRRRRRRGAEAIEVLAAPVVDGRGPRSPCRPVAASIRGSGSVSPWGSQPLRVRAAVVDRRSHRQPLRALRRRETYAGSARRRRVASSIDTQRTSSCSSGQRFSTGPL